jgi:hypothetical protein
MKTLTLFISLFITSNLFADTAWKCSNWKPFFSSILVHTGARNTLLSLSEPTDNLKKAKENHLQSQKAVQELKTKTKFEFHSVIVKHQNKYHVVLDECWTQSEAGSLMLKLSHLSGVGMLVFKEGLYSLASDPDCPR